MPAAAALEAELAALRELERGAPGDETLLLWEAESVCAVLPRSGTAAEHLVEAACAEIPVLRRESGGGAVVAGPGCLNYAFVFSLERRPELLDVERSYEEILGRVAAALRLPGVRAIGSDLVFDDRKFGGSAQRRTRRALLHHGTILYDFDLAQASRMLREPARQPAYRRGRAHDLFLTNAPLSLGELSAAFERVAAGELRAEDWRSVGLATAPARDPPALAELRRGLRSRPPDGCAR